MSMADDESGWTISELAAAARTVLSRQDLDQTSNRVRAIPDVRMIRYYASAGLLDRPQSFRGRTALYGPRHLAQLVAIKRLQAAGEALDDIRERLAVTTALPDLQRLAGIAVDTPAPPAPARQRVQRRFWDEAPSPAAVTLPVAEAIRAVGLGSGVTLTVGAGPALTDSELSAIAAAAMPLMRELAALGVINEGG